MWLNIDDLTLINMGNVVKFQIRNGAKSNTVLYVYYTDSTKEALQTGSEEQCKASLKQIKDLLAYSGQVVRNDHYIIDTKAYNGKA